MTSRRATREPQNGVNWVEWSKEAFDEARTKGKLVLLDLTASWCHWCHVMDRTTYSDPSVAEAINESFVPVRVDIDRRPDISDRYNRGGFPTTAFLSDMGESIWGATYVPPADMRRIIDAILKSKASGEIDQALERSRMQYLDLSKVLDRRTHIDSERVGAVFEDIFSAYDVEFGGFGLEPKFPHPEVVELLLHRYVQNKDEELSEAVVNTLDRMAEGLYDDEEGGIFRYSVTRNWHTPHYEKMLETNAGFLRNLVLAAGILGHKRYEALAHGVAKYMLTNLRDPISGGFYGSQDADEEYYRLPLSDRKKGKAPSVDKTVYSGWNSEAAQALMMAGALLGKSEWTDAGKGAFEHTLRSLWDSDKGLVKHTKEDAIFLLDDQVQFLDSILTAIETGLDQRVVEIADKVIRGIDSEFPDIEGAYSDLPKGHESIGELGTPRKELVSNSRLSRVLGVYGAVVHRPELLDKARSLLAAFTPKEVEAHGVFASAYVIAWSVLEKGARSVEVHYEAGDGRADELWRAARLSSGPETIVVRVPEERGRRTEMPRPYAIVCTAKGCSRKISSVGELVAELAG